MEVLDENTSSFSNVRADPVWIRLATPADTQRAVTARERSFGDSLFHGSQCSNALTSATSVGERFWILKTGKSGFRGSLHNPARLTARLVTKTPGQRKDEASFETAAIMMP